MIRFLKKLFKHEPEFKVDDIIIEKDIEFPNGIDYIRILAVGKNKYQYCFHCSSRSVYEARIWYFDTEYKLYQDNVISASGPR